MRGGLRIKQFPAMLGASFAVLLVLGFVAGLTAAGFNDRLSDEEVNYIVRRQLLSSRDEFGDRRKSGCRSKVRVP